jgi:putative CocE/NonD family hydrolase
VKTGWNQEGSRRIEDEGSFRIYWNEEAIGVIKFKLSPDGSYHGRSSVIVAGQSAVSIINVDVDGSGRWRTIVLASAIGVTTIRRKRSKARVTSAGISFDVGVLGDALVCDALSPALISQVTGRYNRRRGGDQRVSLFLTIGTCAVATLRAEGLRQRTIDGKELTLECFQLALAGMRMRVWVHDGRVCLVEAPVYHSALVRAGYEALLPGTPIDPLLSAPLHLEVHRNVKVPMRDGVELATDIYRPQCAQRRPVILMRTPYGKELQELSARFYARRGYIVAAQDVRGRFQSAGDWEPLVHEGLDGYDAIEWLAAQSWSSGRIGMAGGSYLAWVQWLAAVERPPHLATIVPVSSPTDPLYNLPYEHGVFCQAAVLWWMDVLESEATTDISGRLLWLTLTKNYDVLKSVGPVTDYDLAILGKKSSQWQRWVMRAPQDSYWQRVAFSERLKRVHLPVFHQTGWHDGTSVGTRMNYERMIACGHPHQKLIIGPWDHAGRISTLAQRDPTSADTVDLQAQTLAWFEYWLKDIDTGILRDPPVRVFVFGSNRWLTGDAYSLPQTRYETWFLTGRSRFGLVRRGRLLRADTPPETAPRRFSYDPADPTPDVGVVEGQAASPMAVIPPHKEVATIRERRDVAVYVSERFRRPYTIVGPMRMVLSASSSARDTDWHVHLMEERRDGTILVLAHGKIRARYRDSVTKPQLLEPGQVYAYDIDLWQIGITISPASRLRLEIASAAFPTFSRNLNTGAQNELETASIPATQLIYHSPKAPSYIVLPVIPGSPPVGIDRSIPPASGLITESRNVTPSPKRERARG